MSQRPKNPWIAGLLEDLAKPLVDPLVDFSIGGPPTRAEVERFEIQDDLAREEDADAARSGVPGAGADTMESDFRFCMIVPSNAEPDPLATMRTGLAVIRTGHRPLGPDFAQQRAVSTDLPALPPPMGMGLPEPISGYLWRRRILPAEGWVCTGLRLSDGVEGCGYCARGLRRRSRLAVLAHDANDLMLSACLDCADKLTGQSVAERNEDEQPIPFAFAPTGAALRDSSLWTMDMKAGVMSQDLSEDFKVRLLKRRHGVAVEIDFPDLAGDTTVVGTYTDLTGALSAALIAVEEWEQR